jgi:hypothetical protein
MIKIRKDGRYSAVVQYKWGIEWNTDNWLDGITRHLIRAWEHPLFSCTAMPRMFDTRREAREWNKRENGYINERPDLKAEPHGWKMPRVVKVKCTFEIIEYD